MRLQQQPPLHLTYCLNAHPGDTWDEHFHVLQNEVMAVKRRVAPDCRFGLGLRLGHMAAQSLSTLSNLNPFIEFLHANDLYVFTVNAFPYGPFHGQPVKDRVYAPDWRTGDRVDYTCLVAELLARFLPDGQRGSISTVPISWKPWMKHDADWTAAAEHIMEMVSFLSTLEQETGKWIQLAFEPEPGCFMETATEGILVFNLLLREAEAKGFREDRLRRYLGFCLDTSHAAVLFENPLTELERYAAEGIAVSKVQLSSALEARCSPHVRDVLAAFSEPVYLHQTVFRGDDGRLQSWPDLAPALNDLAKESAPGTVRTHLHVPLYWNGTGADDSPHSTSFLLDERFFDRLRSGTVEQVEIETYTLQVLPEALRPPTVIDSVAREFDWVRQRLCPSAARSDSGR